MNAQITFGSVRTESHLLTHLTGFCSDDIRAEASSSVVCDAISLWQRRWAWMELLLQRLMTDWCFLLLLSTPLCYNSAPPMVVSTLAHWFWRSVDSHCLGQWKLISVCLELSKMRQDDSISQTAIWNYLSKVISIRFAEIRCDLWLFRL